MARKKKHEEHVNTEAWAIPYGDLITLLLAFFVVMYSMSSVNEGKYRILSDSLIAAFRGAPAASAPVTPTKDAIGKGGDSELSGVSPTALMKLPDPRPPANAPRTQYPRSGGDGRLTRGPSVGRGFAQAPPADSREALHYMADEVRRALQSLIDGKMVRIRQTALTLEIEIKTDILFQSGVARLEPPAVEVLGRVAEILKPFPHPIRVEGHTDDRPISTAVFPSNWELSAARAANVVQLFTSAGLDPLRLEVLGLGEFHPVAANDTPEGRNANRRVVIVVVQAKGDAAEQSVANLGASLAQVGQVPSSTVLVRGAAAANAAAARPAVPNSNATAAPSSTPTPTGGPAGPSVAPAPGPAAGGATP